MAISATFESSKEGADYANKPQNMERERMGERGGGDLCGSPDAQHSFQQTDLASRKHLHPLRSLQEHRFDGRKGTSPSSKGRRGLGICGF